MALEYTQEHLELVQEGIKYRDLTAPRPPQAVLESMAGKNGQTVDQLLWELYMHHVPYTDQLTLEQAGEMFPYIDYCHQMTGFCERREKRKAIENDLALGW